MLADKEKQIEELFAKVKEYDECLDTAEKEYKSKLNRKAQVPTITIWLCMPVYIPFDIIW